MSSSNPILVGGGPSSQSIRTVTTEPRHQMGAYGILPDGRCFRYASNTGSGQLSPGQLCQSENVSSNFTNVSVSADADIGTRSVSVTLGGSSSVDLNEYAGGYLFVNDSTGEGHTYAIESNAAISSATAFNVVLGEDIAVALVASASQVTIAKSRWAGVTEAGSGHVHFAAGWPQAQIPAGNVTPQYFWMLTKGETAGADDASTAVGAVLQSGTTAGEAEIGDGLAQPIGVQLVTGVAGEHRPKFATID